MKVTYDEDGWISVHPQKQHIEFTYPMLAILYQLPGSCWKTLAFMMQNCYQYDEAAADYVRGPREMSVRYIADGSCQNPSSVTAALETLKAWRLVIQVTPGAPATRGKDGVPASWTVNWYLRVRPSADDGWIIEGVDTPFTGKCTPRPVADPAAGEPERMEKPHASVRKNHTPAYGKTIQRSYRSIRSISLSARARTRRASAPCRCPPY